MYECIQGLNFRSKYLAYMYQDIYGYNNLAIRGTPKEMKALIYELERHMEVGIGGW